MEISIVTIFFIPIWIFQSSLGAKCIIKPESTNEDFFVKLFISIIYGLLMAFIVYICAGVLYFIISWILSVFIDVYTTEINKLLTFIAYLSILIIYIFFGVGKEIKKSERWFFTIFFIIPVIIAVMFL